MPKPSKQIIIDFIVAELRQGKNFDTCLKLCGTKWNLTRSTFIRRWKEANIQHTTEQDLIKAELLKVSTEAATESLKKQILTADERKELLTKIAKGEMKTKQPLVMNGKVVEYPAEPSASERMKAIAELNKMEGDYAPAKVAQTDAAGNDIKVEQFVKLPDGQLMKI